MLLQLAMLMLMLMLLLLLLPVHLAATAWWWGQWVRAGVRCRVDRAGPTLTLKQQ